MPAIHSTRHAPQVRQMFASTGANPRQLTIAATPAFQANDDPEQWCETLALAHDGSPKSGGLPWVLTPDRARQETAPRPRNGEDYGELADFFARTAEGIRVANCRCCCGHHPAGPLANALRPKREKGRSAARLLSCRLRIDARHVAAHPVACCLVQPHRWRTKERCDLVATFDHRLGAEPAW
jgi:hypothetical protein